ncbi:MAG: universal stress protein [Verrucomicrobiaceae bacterium]|nr:universal stress protein [Verrucomicrobiaceae bacterium]
MNSALPPGSWKKVLVPTDFSDCARVALETTAAWHRDTGGAVVLLHVCEPGYEGLRVQTSGLHQQMEQAARDELAQAQRVHFPQAENVRALVVPGRPAETICRVAAEEDVDAIVIPTHGHSGLARALLGSVAEKVVRHAPCSVLIVRE